MSSRGKRSIPAGTGVWVVNMVPEPDGDDCLREAQSAPGHEGTDALQAEETGVALVGVEHLRGLADRLQRPDAAHAEQDLLADPVFGSSAVEPVGDVAHFVVVVVHVGVEQVQLHPSHLGQPDLSHEGTTAQVDRDLLAVHQGQRHCVGVEDRVVLLLPASRVELLAEVPVAVHQPDAGQRHAQARCRLQMVARQDAQAARVLGQGLGDAELRGEVGDGPQRRLRQVLKPTRSFRDTGTGRAGPRP